MCLSHLIYTVRPCLIHTCHAMPMPCSDKTVLLKATTQHVRRETACGLPAGVRLLPTTTRNSTKVVIRSISISDAGGQCETKQPLSWTRKRVVAAYYKKDDLLNCWTSSSDISGYHEDFHEGQHYRSMAGTRHGMCELMAWQGNGMGTAWHVSINGTAWQGHGMGTACCVWIGLKGTVLKKIYLKLQYCTVLYFL